MSLLFSFVLVSTQRISRSHSAAPWPDFTSKPSFKTQSNVPWNLLHAAALLHQGIWDGRNAEKEMQKRASKLWSSNRALSPSLDTMGLFQNMLRGRYISLLGQSVAACVDVGVSIFFLLTRRLSVSFSFIKTLEDMCNIVTLQINCLVWDWSPNPTISQDTSIC